MPGAQTAGSAFRFRIISYNILAELFATKQVSIMSLLVFTGRMMVCCQEFDNYARRYLTRT